MKNTEFQDLKERLAQFKDGGSCGQDLSTELILALLRVTDDKVIIESVEALGKAVDRNELKIRNLLAGTKGKSFDELFAMGN